MVRSLQQPAEAPAPRFSPEASAPPAWYHDAASGDGPARRLQQELERALAGVPADRRWSARRSVAFVLAANGLFWLALIAGLRAVL